MRTQRLAVSGGVEGLALCELMAFARGEDVGADDNEKMGQGAVCEAAESWTMVRFFGKMRERLSEGRSRGGRGPGEVSRVAPRRLMLLRLAGATGRRGWRRPAWRRRLR